MRMKGILKKFNVKVRSQKVTISSRDPRLNLQSEIDKNVDLVHFEWHVVKVVHFFDRYH